MEEKELLKVEELKASFDSFIALTETLDRAIKEHLDCGNEIKEHFNSVEEMKKSDYEVEMDQQTHNRVYDLGLHMVYRHQLVAHIFSWAKEHLDHYKMFNSLHYEMIQRLEDECFHYRNERGESPTQFAEKE